MVHDLVVSASYTAPAYCLLWKSGVGVLDAGADPLTFPADFPLPGALYLPGLLRHSRRHLAVPAPAPRSGIEAARHLVCSVHLSLRANPPGADADPVVADLRDPGRPEGGHR